MLGDSTVDEVAEAYALYTVWHLERSITSNDAVDNPSLASRELSQTGRYFWSEVISLGGYDVLVKPFNVPDIFRMMSLAWESWKDRTRGARA